MNYLSNLCGGFYHCFLMYQLATGKRNYQSYLIEQRYSQYLK